MNLASYSWGARQDDANFFSKKSESSFLKMCFNIEYSCHTITNIKHGRRLSLQLMTN